jgi:hypothetical protein
MSPKEHVIYGGAASAALYPAMGVNALLFFAASFAIDFDHYLDYVYHNGFKDFSLKRMFGYHNALERMWDRPEFLNMEVFHTIEFIVPLFAAARLLDSLALEAVFWGITFHVLLDMVYLYRMKIFFKRSYSMTEYFIRRRALEMRGLKPVELYLSAVREAME